jgi:hypothetical protein
MKSRKHKQRFEWAIEENVYETFVVLFAGCSYARLIKRLPILFKGIVMPLELNRENTEAVCGIAMNSKNKNLGYYIWIKKVDWTTDFYATLAHEVYHLVNRIMVLHNSWDIPDNDGVPNDEHYAYYIGFWMKSLLNCLNEERKLLERSGL